MSPYPHPAQAEHVPEAGPGAGVKRWRVHDTLEDMIMGYEFHINPKSMTSPYPERTISAQRSTAGPSGQWLLTEGQQSPTQWTFSGDILTRDQFEKMEFWFSRKALTRLALYDHFGRELIIVPQKFAPVPKRAIGRYWRHTYDVNALVLGITPRIITNNNFPGHG